MTYSFKKVFSYICDTCKKKRSTTKNDRAELGMCKSCEVYQKFMQGQPQLFETVENTGDKVNK